MAAKISSTPEEHRIHGSLNTKSAKEVVDDRSLAEFLHRRG
jgi:hypothetical protein